MVSARRQHVLESKPTAVADNRILRYVLSPTHLHEFKSADKTQAPVMSLYLPEQKLGSHSSEGGSSNKFVLKGRQTGSLHRGHTWVFRAESHDTMMAWYEDIKALTEKSPEERSNFVRVHSRSFSRSSQRSFSSDGVVDEDDDEPFAAANLVNSHQPRDDAPPKRPEPGGRFPSDLQVNAQRGLQTPLSPSSLSSGFNETQDHDAIAAAAALPGSGFGQSTTDNVDPGVGYGSTVRTPMDEAPSHAAVVSQEAREDGVNPYTSVPIQRRSSSNYKNAAVGQQEYFDPSVIGTRELGNQEPGEVERVAFQPPVNSSAGGSYSAWANGDQNAAPTAGAGTANYIISPSVGQHEAQPSYAELEPNPPVAAGHNPGDVSFAASPTMGKAEGAGYGLEPSQTQPSTMEVQHQSNTEQPDGTTVRNDRMQSISNMHVPGEYPRGTYAP